MPTPENPTWARREVVTASTMNTRVRDPHRFLYQSPSCRVTARQRGTYRDSSVNWVPADALDPGGKLSGRWFTFAWYLPGQGIQPPNEFDTAALARPDATATGVPYALRLYAPEDGRYDVAFGGVIDAPGTKPLNMHVKLGKNMANESMWSDDARVFASSSPGRSNITRGFGSLAAAVRLKKGESVSAGGICDQSFLLGNKELPGRSFFSMRWVGRY
ncbi:hypothetical protein IPZ58_05210 [Streptomyces roseoverticillatus]|uniref:hypothetical protein n=1 Tax=Streptomyces roseoverticillatus TaxID=66429 RepID=UPI001F41EBBF|nr:hypothetical protein [Streptomyces roseoverticillatus]MCF3100973.1 hypothetical protein [Streptomyces roseoverticillatus]